MDWGLLGPFVHGILQARILEWVAFPTPGDLPDPGIEPTFLVSLALAGGFFTTEPPGKPSPVSQQYNLIPVLFVPNSDKQDLIDTLGSVKYSASH